MDITLLYCGIARFALLMHATYYFTIITVPHSVHKQIMNDSQPGFRKTRV